MSRKVLDACCGSRMFWFDKHNPIAVFADNRKFEDTLCDGRILEVNPDVISDFRDMPFQNESFYLVVFDPPHLLHAGQESWLAKKYGVLGINWKEDIPKGFSECMRVLKPNGTMIFKWNEEQISLPEILSTINYKPLFGQRRSKTHFLVFFKEATQRANMISRNCSMRLEKSK